MKSAAKAFSMALCAAFVLTPLAASSDEPFDIQSQVGPNPVLPDIQQYLFPPMHLASVVGWKNGEKPTVAPGLKIEALASDLQHPRSLYTLPNGDVLVVESKAPPPQPITRPKDIVMRFIEKGVTSGGDPGPSNRITLLRYDAGGKPPTRSVFLDHLHSPFGVVLVGDDLYVANTDAIVRYPYHDGDQTISASGVTLTPLPGGPIDHHWTKSLTASRDGSLLYVGVGSNSNITENGIEAEKNRAAIWEVDRASGRWRIFASGLRNPNGLTFEPESGALWTVVNERDELGPDLVPDYLTSVKDGAFYGWPYSYYGQHLDPRVHPQRPDLVEKAIAPDYALSSHVAPLGLVFYTAGSLPQKYRGGAFVGEHGSWDRPTFNGYKVVFVPFSGGVPMGKLRMSSPIFLTPTGRREGGRSDSPLTRPVRF
jgi:glucose/arabinose dehydrogenase